MTNAEAIDTIKCLAWHTRPDEEALDMAIEALSAPTIPLSVIEKIKAELTSKAPRHFDGEIAKKSCWFSLDEVLEIIDKAVKEIEHEASN